MNIVVEKQPKCVATLKVEIPAQTVSSERARITKGYANQAKIPGFRPGKAPQSIVAKRYQKDIEQELFSQLVQNGCDEAIRQENLKVLDFGTPNVTAEGETFTFETRLILAPDVTLPEYKGISVKAPKADVPEADIEKQLTEIADRMATFNNVEGRGLAEKDYAVIDFTSSTEGKSLEEFLGKPAGFLGGREAFWLRIEEESFLPGFTKNLIGQTVGETREVTSTIPDDFPLSGLRGKEVKFSVTLKEIKEAVVPEINDEFAAKLLPEKTLEDIKTLIRENLAGERQRIIEDKKVQQIIEFFDANVEVEVPDELIEAETQNQANLLIQRNLQQGVEPAIVEAQREEILENARKQARVNLKSNFILQEIAQVEKIEVSNQELLQHIYGIAQQRNEKPEKVLRSLQSSGRLNNVRNSLLVGKAVDFLVSQANVEETDEDLTA